MIKRKLPQSELQRFFDEKQSISVNKLAKESGFNNFTLYALKNAKCKYTETQAELLVEKVVPVMLKYGFMPKLER